MNEIFFGSKSSSMECYGHSYVSIKIAIFKTLRRPDTTSNFDFSIVFLYEAPFSTSILFFANNKTLNYPCIFMELSFRSGPP